GISQLAMMIDILFVISTYIFKNLFCYFSMQHMMYLKNGVLNNLRKDMYKKIIELPLNFYSKRQKGDVMARILGDINEMQNSFFIVLELIVREPASIIYSLIFMFTFSWNLTLFVLLFIQVATLLVSRFGNSLKSNSLKAQLESGKLISIVEESLTGLKI